METVRKIRSRPRLSYAKTRSRFRTYNNVKVQSEEDQYNLNTKSKFFF